MSAQICLIILLARTEFRRRNNRRLSAAFITSAALSNGEQPKRTRFPVRFVLISVVFLLFNLLMVFEFSGVLARILLLVRMIIDAQWQFWTDRSVTELFWSRRRRSSKIILALAKFQEDQRLLTQTKSVSGRYVHAEAENSVDEQRKNVVRSVKSEDRLFLCPTSLDRRPSVWDLFQYWPFSSFENRLLVCDIAFR